MAVVPGGFSGTCFRAAGCNIASMKRLSIPLRDLFPTLDWTDTKFHIAQRSDTGVQPLDELTRDFNHWRDDWTGKYHSKRVWSCSDLTDGLHARVSP